VTFSLYIDTGAWRVNVLARVWAFTKTGENREVRSFMTLVD
jgi:hypothetical protein